jgi:antitoxin VapB
MTKTTAKLFMHGRSQAVRLPKKFRMAGTEVEISRVGDIVTLKPRDKLVLTDVQFDEFWSELDAFGPTEELYPDGWRKQNLLPLQAKVRFD